MEILAPVGNMEVLKSAISAGCDAVYLAGTNYGARAYAGNFSNDELLDAIKYAHFFGVKVYITVNTLLFEDEIDGAMKFIGFIYNAGCDAVIIQDLGLASLIHENYPDLKMHASTQINAQTLEDVEILKRIGFSRVILGREVSIDEIKRIKNSNIDIELEAFVHGALCISYSGNCLFSSFDGGRSGNRGRCAQPCRKSYELFNKKGFFLSPKDLCTIDEIKELSKYLDSMKIEGRMKSASYVYNVVKSYKKALDGAKNFEELKYNMKVAFNRGYTKGFILNETNAGLTNIKASNHQGVEVGHVVSSTSGVTDIKLTKELFDGDSIRIVGRKEEDSIIINGMYVGKALVRNAKAGSVVTVRSHLVMDSDDVVLLTKREEAITNERLIDLTLTVKNDDSDLIVSFYDGKNTVSGKIHYEEARSLQNERLLEQIKKTGGTMFRVDKVKNFLSKEIFVSVKEINELRRNLLDELKEKRENWYSRSEINVIKYPYLDIIRDDNKISEYLICVSNNDELDEVESFLKYNKLDGTIATRFKSDYLACLPRVGVTNKSDNAVSSNLGSQGRYSSVYFNVTNSYTVRLMESLGYACVGLSVELARLDIKKLVNGYKNRYNSDPNLMMMVYGRIELMHMKHCFINKALNKESMHCDKCKEDVLFDNKYPVYGDLLCHLSILSSDPLYLLSKISDLKEIGIKTFCLNFYKESKEDVRMILEEIDEPIDGGYFGHYYKEVL